MRIDETSAETAPFALLQLADPSLERIKEHLANGVLFVGFQEQVPVVAAIINELSDAMEITNIAVAAEHQGQGIGKKMISYLIEHAKASGYRLVVVGTGNSSLNQIAFYQKCGFRVSGVVQEFFQDDPPIYENGIRCIDRIRFTHQT